VRSETDDGPHRKEAPGGMPTYRKALPLDIVGAFFENDMHRIGKHIPPVALLSRLGIHVACRSSMALAVCGLLQIRLELTYTSG
jgi:hypothetical protein